jgi:hypothetical protein
MHRLAIALLLLVLSSGVVLADDVEVKGVSPKDNITKTEVFYKLDVLEDDQTIQSIVFKYDYAFDAAWGLNVELPLVRYDGFGIEEAGLGDVNVRARYVTALGALSVLAGAELVAPTATDDVLGRGKWQTNLVAGAVYPLAPTTFVYAGYKHVLGFGGDDDRPDIHESQPRLIAAYTSPDGWWALGDGKLTRSWEGDDTTTLDVELEAGTMLGPSTAVWVRGGTSFLDSNRDFGVTVGFRLIQ